MGELSDEEVILRKQKSSHRQRKKNLESLFDEQDESISRDTEYDTDSLPEYVNNVSSTALRKIFGTGKEYMYILDPVPEIDPYIDSDAEDIPAEKYEQPLDVEEVLSFVRDNIYTEVTMEQLKSIVELIIDGICVQFIVLHCPTIVLTIQDAYRIYDLVEYYRSNRSLIENLRKNKTFNLEVAPHLKARTAAFPFDMKQVWDSKVILTLDQFKENMQGNERVFVPIDLETTPEDFFVSIGTSELEFRSCLSKEVVKNPFFRAEVIRWCFFNGEVVYKKTWDGSEKGRDAYVATGEAPLSPERESISEHVKNLRMHDHLYDVFIDREELLKHFSVLYISGSNDTPWNKVRESILQRAINAFNFVHFLKDRINEACKEKLKTELFSNLVDRIVNGRIEVKDHESRFVGVTIERQGIRASIIDYVGDLVDYMFYNFEEMPLLANTLEKYGLCSIYLSGCALPQLKFFVKAFQKDFPGITLFYVESRLLKTCYSSKELPQKVARMVLFPEVEYAHIIQEGFDVETVPCMGCLSYKEKALTLERALTTSLSIVGVDLNLLLKNKQIQVLLKYIPGLELDKKIKSYGFIEKLEVLRNKEMLSEKDYTNAATFLRIFPSLHKKRASFDILDSLAIHPSNYRYARMCCAAVLDYEEIDDENPSNVVEEIMRMKHKLSQFDLKSFEKNTELYPIIELCVNVLGEEKRYFQGLPDNMIFDDLIGDRDQDALYEGRVVKCGPSFYLVDVEGSFTVFIRRTCDLHLNQLVKVKLLAKNYSTLSFEGSIVSDNDKMGEHGSVFSKHPLFRSLNFLEAEEYLKNNEEDFLIRRSSQGNHYCIIVIRLSDDIFLHLKIEKSGDQYVCAKRYFEDIDEIINTHVRSIIRMLKSIKSHVKYFPSPEEAGSYLSAFDGSKILYAFYLSKEYPGKLVFSYNSGDVFKEYIGIEGPLSYNKRTFSNLEEFLSYRKSLG